MDVNRNLYESIGLKIDPRTKIYVLVIMNIIVISSKDLGSMSFMRPLISAIPLVLLFIDKKMKPAVIYLVMYLIALYINQGWMIDIKGIIGMLLALFSGLILVFGPCGMMGYYLVVSTRVNEFIAAMDRMKVPKKITISFSVVFRFFPTIVEEYRDIKSAMRLRGVGFVSGSGNIITFLEYRMVPLIMSVVKIGNDLTAAAMTRGLSSQKERSHISEIGFGLWDIIFSVIVTAAIITYVFIR
ncbi:energy-coupling factor transporter transmembrane component T [Clostridiaceae bacterium M8S5]|nr:energy-coupling factor transporter transmembrane component T [Clostridiaceae bacterium M8S5]